MPKIFFSAVDLVMTRVRSRVRTLDGKSSKVKRNTLSIKIRVVPIKSYELKVKVQIKRNQKTSNNSTCKERF